MEFRLWLDAFQTAIHRYSFRSAFDFENPVVIPEASDELRVEVRGALLEWLDDHHRKLIFGEKCPIKCLQKVKSYHEPATVRSYSWLAEICKMRFNPAVDNLSTWLDSFEENNRKLLACEPDWEDKDKVECLMGIMERPFPNLSNVFAQSGGKITYEELKGVLEHEQKLYMEREELFTVEKGAARVAGNKSQSNNFNNKFSGEQLRTCYRCDKPGHLAQQS